MFLSQTLHRLRFLLAYILLVTFMLACSDDDTPLQAEEEHFEAIGTVVYDASAALTLSILRGVTTDTLYAVNGELSDHYTVKFYDEDENIIDPPDEEHAEMGYEVTDTSILEIWQHPGEEGGFEFHLRGLAVGQTTLELFVKHEGHNDYRSGKIPVVVR